MGGRRQVRRRPKLNWDQLASWDFGVCRKARDVVRNKLSMESFNTSKVGKVGVV